MIQMPFILSFKCQSIKYISFYIFLVQHNQSFITELHRFTFHQIDVRDSKRLMDKHQLEANLEREPEKNLLWL